MYIYRDVSLNINASQLKLQCQKISTETVNLEDKNIPGQYAYSLLSLKLWCCFNLNMQKGVDSSLLHCAGKENKFTVNSSVIAVVLVVPGVLVYVIYIMLWIYENGGGFPNISFFFFTLSVP